KEYRQPSVEKFQRNNRFFESSSMLTSEPATFNDLIAALYRDEELDKVTEKDE
ncbi:6284_t:CDS:1, partial [Acaulospora morrowiae]